VQLLTVRDVSEALKVCRATVYGLMDRGELARIWVGASLRVPIESLSSYQLRRSGIANPRRRAAAKADPSMID
jgi:hypothetical protein